MKRVSLEIAKALKDAGYPQPQTDVWGYVIHPNNCYFTGKYSYYDEYRERRLEWDEKDEFHTTDDWADEIEPSFYGSAIAAPSYLEVWLWLIREKKINLSPIYWNSDKSWHVPGFIKDRCNDPEDAIISAINYLVENKLLK